MRTKTLLLSAVALAAGLLSTQAQSNVYSANVVGYVKVVVPTNKYAIVSGTMDFTGPGGNNITNVLGGTISDGTTVFKFSGGAFQDPEIFFEGFGWFPGTTILNPGDGFFVQTPSTGDATLTMVGNVLQGSGTNSLIAGYSMVGGKVPQQIPIGVLGTTAATNTFVFPAVDGDTLFFFDVPTQSYKDAISYFDGYGWFDTGPGGPGPIEGPSLKVGEGFFVSKSGGATNWVRSFTVQ